VTTLIGNDYLFFLPPSLQIRLWISKQVCTCSILVWWPAKIAPHGNSKMCQPYFRTASSAQEQFRQISLQEGGTLV